MQHHLTGLGSPTGLGLVRRAGCVKVEGELVPGDLAGGERSAYVEGLGRPQHLQRLGTLGQGGVEVEGVGEVELAVDLAGAVEGDLLVLDGEVSPVRGLPGVFGGLVGHEPGDCFGDQPLQRGDPDPVREWRHLGIHERRRFHRQPEGGLSDPAGTPGLQVTALHPSPARDQPVLRSTAAATIARPPSVERPIASANSAMQNSATNGAPGPAIVRPVSPPGVIQVAASSIDSGGCCSAQVTAAVSSTASAWVAAARAARAPRSTSAEESSSSKGMLVVDVMTQFKHRPLTETGQFPLLWKGILDQQSVRLCWFW